MADIVFIITALIAAILCLPTLLWALRKKTAGLASLGFWLILLNSINSVRISVTIQYDAYIYTSSMPSYGQMMSRINQPDGAFFPQVRTFVSWEY